MVSVVYLPIAILVLIALANADDLIDWDEYKLSYSKQYRNEEEEKQRMDIFTENKEKIEGHNRRYEQGDVSYKMGLNKYSDLTTEEFSTFMNGFIRSDNVGSAHDSNDTINYEKYVFKGSSNCSLPKSVDWRKSGAVTPVKDQQNCGACWAFSALAALESHVFIKHTGPLKSLSVQNLVDCSSVVASNYSYANFGCSGGIVDDAFRYIQDNGGIATEESYPYEANDRLCRFNRSINANVTVKGFKDIPVGDERKLMEAIATVGPVAVAIHASHESLHHYQTGVFHEPKCVPEKIDHGVLAVGYGTDESGQDYYIIKNSWSAEWGEKGFIRLLRNNKNHCGIAMQASFPVV